MANIAILIPTLGQGGAEKQATLLATMLDKHHKVDVYLLYGDRDIAPQNRELLDRSNVTLHPLHGGMLAKLRQLKHYFKEHNTEILFNYLTSCNVIGGIAARRAGVGRIYSGIRNAQLEWSKMVADRFIHNNIATGTIYNCYSGAEHFTSKGFKASKNIVIPNGFQHIAEGIVREERDIKHIVTAGRFVPQKDYKTMIRTIARLKELRHDFMLDIIGYGNEEHNIRGWIDEYGVHDYVNIFIKPNNVQEILCNGDIYLSTSLFEGTSNSIMEALNWSLPVVATAVGDNSRLIDDGTNGTLHAIGDVEGMALSLERLLSSITLRNDYGNEGHRRLMEHYSMAAFEAHYMELIDGL